MLTSLSETLRCSCLGSCTHTAPVIFLLTPAMRAHCFVAPGLSVRASSRLFITLTVTPKHQVGLAPDDATVHVPQMDTPTSNQ